MDHYRRYALYYTPPQGEFADFGASWLGWDAVRGAAVAQPDLPGLDIAALTAEPRKYGFHATLKAPFRLAEGARAEDLAAAVATLAAQLRPVTLDGLALTRIGPRPTLITTAPGRIAAKVIASPSGVPYDEIKRLGRPLDAGGRVADGTWLEALADDPGEFLRRRLEAEHLRRISMGLTAPDEGDPW